MSQDAELALVLRNTMAALADAQAALGAWLDGRPLTVRDRHRIELVFEELAANIVMHGYPEGPDGRHLIQARLSLRPGRADWVLEDDGSPFDPRGAAGRRLDEAGEDEEARIGGLGLLLVRRFTASMVHQRAAGGANRLDVVIPLDDSPATP